MSREQNCQCGGAHGGCTSEFQYAVKLLCGVSAPSKEGTEVALAAGRYWTAINIHNPDKCKDAHFRWKVAQAGHGAPGPIPRYQPQISLGPDRALEIDWPLILQTFSSPLPTSVAGYLVIESDIELDVVGVYTTAPNAAGPISAFHTERVQPRCVPVCEDLVLVLNTGFADWQTVAPTAGLLGPVQHTAAQPGWAAAPLDRHGSVKPVLTEQALPRVHASMNSALTYVPASKLPRRR